MRISDWSSDVCSSDLRGHSSEPSFGVGREASSDEPLHIMNGHAVAAPVPNGSARKATPGDDWRDDSGVSRKRRWSEADDQSLRKLWHSNHSLEEIAEAMGRTTPSLYSRARALGMSKRSPANAEKAVASAPDRKSTRLNSSH